MTQTASLSLADHLALIIEGLCQAVARRVGPGTGSGGIAGPLIILIWTRLRRIAARFTRAMAAPPPSRPAARRRAPSPRKPRPHLLPRRKAWLLRLAPETASGASQLRHFLADPEVAALLANNPQLSRILRPLCRMLGIRAAGIRAAAIHPAKAAPPPDMAPAEPPSAPVPRDPPEQTAPVPPAPWPAPPPLPDSAPAPA